MSFDEANAAEAFVEGDHESLRFLLFAPARFSHFAADHGHRENANRENDECPEGVERVD